jgi:gliding motility-associated-like protein
MRYYLFIFIQLSLCYNAKAQQKEGNWWFFGQQAGIVFNNIFPTPHLLNNLTGSGSQGAGTISDKNGKLLFYCNGTQIRNKTGALMPNGSNIFPGGSGQRQVLIIQSPIRETLFYVVVAKLGSGDNLAFSEIDMNLDNGLGDVIQSTKNTVIMSNSSYKMSVFKHINNKDYWFVTHEIGNQNFRVYKIDTIGFNLTFITQPVGSNYANSGTLGGFSSGFIKSSPNSEYFAVRLRDIDSIELYLFNRLTGQITLLVNFFARTNGLSAGGFSPDNSKYFFSSGDIVSPLKFDTLFQLDLSNQFPPNILGSKQLVSSIASTSGLDKYQDLQIGIDGKIYVILENGIKYLSVIDCPNAYGIASFYQDSVVDLLGRFPGNQLPTLNQTLFVNANILQAQSDKDTICLGDSINLSAFGAGADAFQWVRVSGPGPSGLSATTGGLIKASPQVGTHVYRAVGFKTCGAPDTATVRLVVVPSSVANTGPNQTVCRGDTVQIGSTNSTGTYRWARLPAAPVGNLLSDSTAQRPFFRSAFANPAQNQFTFVLQSRNAGCSRTDTVTVNLNNLPSALNLAGPDTSKCATAPIQLGTGSVPNLSYAWALIPSGLPTGLQNPTTAQPLLTFVPPATATNPQTFTYRLQVTDSNGCRNADTVQVFVRPLSKRLAGADLSFCSGDSAQTGTANLTGVAYSWRVEPINPFSGTASLSDTSISRPIFSASHTDSMARQFRLIVRGVDIPLGIGSQCSNQDTAIATVNPLPTADSVFTFTTCSGVPLTLSEPIRPNYTYLWRNSINSPLSILNSFTNTLFNSDTLQRTDSLLLTLTDTLTACSKTVIRLVRINPLPRPNAGPDSLICSSDTINIGTPPRTGLSYFWSPNTGIQNPNNSQSLFTSTNAANTNLIQTRVLLATDSLTGCQNRDTVRITVSGVPRANITGPLSVCPGLEGAFYTLNGLNPFATIAQGWQVHGGQIDSTTLNSLIVSWDSIPTDSAKVILIPTNARGCKGDTARLIVRINKELATETPKGDTVVCSGTGNRTYSILNTTGSSYFWQAQGTNILSGQGTNSITLRIPDTLSQTTTFSVWVNESTVTRTDTCLGNSDTLQITVNPSPVRRSILPNSPTAPNLCANDTIAVNLNGTAISLNSSYNWQILSTQGALINGQGNDTAGIRLNPSTTSYTLPIRVRETSDKGCLGPQIDTILQINPQPITQAGGDSTLCSGDSLQLGVTAQSSTTYNWSPTTNLSNSSNAQPIFTSNNFGTTPQIIKYTLSTQNAQGCRNRDSIVLTVNPEPAPGAQIVGPQGWCSTDTVFYNLNPTGAGSTLNWTIQPIGTLLSNQIGFVLQLLNSNPQDSSQYQIKVLETNSLGCKGDAIQRTISLFPQPQPQLSTDSIACEGNPDFQIEVTNPRPGSSFNWQVQQTNPGQILGQGTPNIRISFGNPFGDNQTRSLQVVETSSQGCKSDTVEKTIYLDGSNAEILRATTLPTDERQVEVLYRINNPSLTNQFSRAYELQRSLNLSPFQTIFSSIDDSNRFTEATPTGYPAEAVQYRLRYFDACNVDRQSSIHQLIRLSGSVTEEPLDQSQSGYRPGNTQLNWNEYLGWQTNAPERFDLFRSTTSAPASDFLHRQRVNPPWEESNGSDAFTQTYRIKATTQNEEDTIRFSWSNSLILSYQNPLKFFNLVTPNGDGLNETFVISNVQLYDHRLTILDRWGRTVLQTDRYNNDWSTKVGGTYFYRLDNKSTGEQYSGWVMVVE